MNLAGVCFIDYKFNFKFVKMSTFPPFKLNSCFKCKYSLWSLAVFHITHDTVS